MYPPAIYKNRIEAGKKLGQKLKALKLKNSVVLAIPSGGIPVGIQVAKILDSPFDLMIVRKIQFPWTTEAGFGAVATDGTIYLGPAAREMPRSTVESQTQKALSEVKHREKEFLKGKRRIKLKDKSVILIDDGLATGSTMFVAVQVTKKGGASKVIVAVPTASQNAVDLIKPHVDKLISLYIHPKDYPFAVASSYKKWHDLTDEEVKKHLKT